MRLLVINPNTTEAMTAKVADAARVALPGVAITAVTGRFGPRYIASRASFAIAGHAALDAYAAHADEHDAVLLACFGDPALDALREISPVPVIGLVEAACREAAQGGRRFAIVTGGERWGPMLTEMIAARGLGAQLAAIRTVAPTGGDIARDPEGSASMLAEACQACVREAGAQAVILGGAGLIGLTAIIADRVDADVICSNEAGFRAAADALAASARHPEAGTGAVETTGLSPALAGLMARGHL